MKQSIGQLQDGFKTNDLLTTNDDKGGSFPSHLSAYTPDSAACILLPPSFFWTLHRIPPKSFHLEEADLECIWQANTNACETAKMKVR